MKWLLALLVVLVACSSVDLAVEDAAVEKDKVIADLQTKIATLNSKVEDLANKNKVLENSSNENLEKMVSGQKLALKDYAQSAATCEAELKDADEKIEELEKKSKVLQGWVDACEETLGKLG